MSPFALPLLLADIFDRFRLQLPDPIINALTPIWILCVGAAAGLLLTAAIWGVLKLLSFIPVIGTLADSPRLRRMAIGTLSALLLAAALMLFFGGQQAGVPVQDRIWAVAGTAVACWLLATAAVTLVSRRALAETGIALREGVLWPLFITACAMSAFALFGLFIVRKPTELLESLVRGPALAMEGSTTTTHALPAPANLTEAPQELEVPIRPPFRRDEIQELDVTSDQHVKLRSESFNTPSDASLVMTLDIPAGETRTWRREQTGTNPFREPVVTKL